MHTYENSMEQQIITSDAEYTIGHIDGKAAQWHGNMKTLEPGDTFWFENDGSYFGVNAADEYRVNAERTWEAQD